MNPKFIHTIQNSRGRFMTATFIKKNGQTRTINFRIPSGSKVDRSGHLTVIERNGNFRKVNFNTIQRLAANGEVFDFSN